MNTTDELDLSGILSPAPVAAETVMPFGTPGLRASVAKETGNSRKPCRGVRVPLYFDIETVPDESRMERFGLEPLPTARPRTPRAIMQSVSDARGKSLEEIRKALFDLNPEESWLAEFEAAEKSDKKPRKGALDMISEIREQDQRIAAAAEDRRKLLAVTPEFCRIVAIGLCRGTETIETAVADGESVTEIDLLESFWSDAEDCHPLVGFNILGFDLPVILIRSAIRGVRPTRKFDLRSWGTDCIDLMAARYPKGPARGLKDLARIYGFDVPAGDVDGSQVWRLYQENPAKLAEYVASDVHLVRQLHSFYRGLFV